MISENLSLIAQKRNELADRLQKTRTYLVSDQVKIIFDWIMEQMGYTYLYGQYKKENKMTYTYDDIVTAKDILTGKVKKEDIVGKKGWLLDCIPQDMSLNVIGRIGQYCCLDKIDLDSDFPFGSDLRPYTYFLPEKEESAPVKSCEEHKLPDEIHELDISVFSSLATIWDIDRPLCPRIKGYTINDSGEIIAFDNTAGEFFVEDFSTREKAISWLNGTETKEEMALKQTENIPESQLSGYYNSRKPEYVPFDLSREEDRQLLRDTWIKSNYNGNEARISAFRHDETSGWQAYIPHTGMRDGEQLFNNYTFIDGTPCGKQIASK